MSRSARRKRGAVTGRQADRCALCGHMRRFHKEHVSKSVAYAVCSKCSVDPPYMHAFKEPLGAEGEVTVRYGTFIVFIDEGVPRDHETHVYRIQVNNISSPEADSIVLGTVKWFGRWRGYAFFPCQHTVYEEVCLREIADFCECATREHYAADMERGGHADV